MKNLISILFVALSFYSCDDIDGEVQNCGTVTNVVYESFNYCGLLKENPQQPTYIIVNSDEEMQKLFTTCQTFAVALPDFTQKRILGLVSPKPTGGYSIKIQSVVEDDCQIIVEYFEKEPKPDDVVTTAITYPSDYVILPKSKKPILFKKVKEIVDYAIVGTYAANPAFTQCLGDCNRFYKIEKYKVIKYLNSNNFPILFNELQYKALGYMDDYAGFLLKVPAEIKSLNGQTKTYGTPGIDNHSGVYFEWSQEGVVTKVYLDYTNSTDQTQNILLFKKAIEDKIDELEKKI